MNSATITRAFTCTRCLARFQGLGPAHDKRHDAMRLCHDCLCIALEHWNEIEDGATRCVYCHELFPVMSMHEANDRHACAKCMDVHHPEIHSEDVPYDVMLRRQHADYEASR